jgi:hypothetical protein
MQTLQTPCERIPGGACPHTDDGVEVRRILRKTHSIAIENFHIPTDLVVARKASDVESSSRLDFLVLPNLETSFIAC